MAGRKLGRFKRLRDMPCSIESKGLLFVQLPSRGMQTFSTESIPLPLTMTPAMMANSTNHRKLRSELTRHHLVQLSTSGFALIHHKFKIQFEERERPVVVARFHPDRTDAFSAHRTRLAEVQLNRI